LAGNKEKSIVFYYRALELSYRNNDISNRILTLLNIANYFQEMSNFDLALDYSLQAYNGSLEIHDNVKVTETADAALHVFKAYFGLQKIDEGIKYGEKGLEIIEPIVQKYNIHSDLQTLEELCFLCGEAYGQKSAPYYENQVFYFDKSFKTMKILLEKHCSESEINKILNELEEIDFETSIKNKIDIMVKNLKYLKNFLSLKKK